MHNPCDADKLRDDQQASDCYDQRYTGDYMQDWPADKLRRVAELVQRLGLGEHGVAVDFGCGNGVFSRVLADVLPGRQIIGMDISPNAIAAATAKHPDIEFRVLEDTALKSLNADFISRITYSSTSSTSTVHGPR